MKISIDEKSGFCFGVVNAISKAEILLGEKGKVFSLGDIVHNKVEMSRLENLGLQSVSYNDFTKVMGKTMIIRAHGEPPLTYQMARELCIDIVDATCPVVAKLQKTVKKAWRQMQDVDGRVVILGKRGHAEVVGLTGQVDEDAIVVENLEDLRQVDFKKPIYLLSQTTQSLELFDEVKAEIYRRAKNDNITIHDTICRQVSNRNPHLREFSKQFDVVIFVSGHHSSNGKALYEVCRAANENTYKIEDGTELRGEWFENAQTVGICGATSTPKWLMEQIATAITTL